MYNFKVFGNLYNEFYGAGYGNTTVKMGGQGAQNVAALDLSGKNDKGRVEQFGNANVSLLGGKNVSAYQDSDGSAFNFAQFFGAKQARAQQNGALNFADFTQSKHGQAIQGGNRDGVVNFAQGGNGISDFKQVTGRNGLSFAKAGRGKASIEQHGDRGSMMIGDGSRQADQIKQLGDYANIFADGGKGNDEMNIHGEHNNFLLDGGKGNDMISVNGDKNLGGILAGAGNDNIFINGDGNAVAVDGGAGNHDALNLIGSVDDDDITQNDDGTWNMVSKDDPDSVITLKDIEHVNFFSEDGQIANNYEVNNEPIDFV